MGFFSWTCAKTNLPIMNSCSGDDIDQYYVVLLRPDHAPVKGVYDGYGRLMAENETIDLTDFTNLDGASSSSYDPTLKNAKLVLHKFYNPETDTYKSVKGKSRNEAGQGHFHNQDSVDAWFKAGGFKTYRAFVSAYNAQE